MFSAEKEIDLDFNVKRNVALAAYLGLQPYH